MTTSQPDPEYKNLTIRVTETKVRDYLKRILMSYLQLRNLILLLIKRNHEEHLAQPEARPKLFSYLSHPGMMRALRAADVLMRTNRFDTPRPAPSRQIPLLRY